MSAVKVRRVRVWEERMEKTKQSKKNNGGVENQVCV